MIRRPPRSTRKESSAASDVYKRQEYVKEVLETKAEETKIEKESALSKTESENKSKK